VTSAAVNLQRGARPEPSPERSNLLTVGECPTGEGATMPAESSFDIVSRIDRQEVDNALNQTAKEIGTRFDFRGVGASIAWSGDHAIDIRANSEERAKAVLDVFKEKLVKRGVSLKVLDPGDPKPSGKEYRLGVGLKEGISSDDARKISKLIRDEGPKGVRAQVQGEELRVSSKKKDDLQSVISLVKGEDFGLALQFVNYR
jgi:cyclic-di-GMP-binding protein